MKKYVLILSCFIGIPALMGTDGHNMQPQESQAKKCLKCHKDFTGAPKEKRCDPCRTTHEQQWKEFQNKFNN